MSVGRYFIIDCDESGHPVKYDCSICGKEFSKMGIMNHKKGCRKDKKNQYSKD